MSEMLLALITSTNAITNANGYPPKSIGLHAGAFQQLREELTSGSGVTILAKPWLPDSREVRLFLPAGALRVFVEGE